MPGISLLSNERVIITGKTGSGKTYLARYLTKHLKRLVVFDSKGTLEDWNLEPYDNTSMRMLLAGQNIRIRAIPSFEEEMGKFWEDIVMTCYRSGNVTIYIDELYAVSPPHKNPPETLWAAYTRGREVGLGIWAGTQRPTWIPMFALSEAEHFFVFRLQLEDDRKRMASFMSDSVLAKIGDEHGFFYMRADMNEPLYVKRLVVRPKSDEAKVEVRVPRVLQSTALSRRMVGRR